MGLAMANFKRRKPRTQIRCTICTPYRYGNAKAQTKPKYLLPNLGRQARYNAIEHIE